MAFYNLLGARNSPKSNIPNKEHNHPSMTNYTLNGRNEPRRFPRLTSLLLATIHGEHTSQAALHGSQFEPPWHVREQLWLQVPSLE